MSWKERKSPLLSLWFRALLIGSHTAVLLSQWKTKNLCWMWKVSMLIWALSGSVYSPVVYSLGILWGIFGLKPNQVWHDQCIQQNLWYYIKAATDQLDMIEQGNSLELFFSSCLESWITGSLQPNIKDFTFLPSNIALLFWKILSIVFYFVVTSLLEF